MSERLDNIFDREIRDVPPALIAGALVGGVAMIGKTGYELLQNNGCETTDEMTFYGPVGRTQPYGQGFYKSIDCRPGVTNTEYDDAIYQGAELFMVGLIFGAIATYGAIKAKIIKN